MDKNLSFKQSFRFTNFFYCFFFSVENDHKLNVYWNAEKLGRKITKSISTFVIVYDQLAYVVGFFYSIYFILTGQFDTTAWPMWFELPVPFDTTLIWGWYLYLLAIAIFDLMYMLCMISVSTYFMSCCCYLEAMCKHIDCIVHSVQLKFDKYNNEIDSRKRKVFQDEIPIKLQTAMLKLIKIHIEINE